MLANADSRPERRVCPRCEQEKPASQFRKDRRTGSKLASYCSQCERTYHSEYKRQWRASLNPSERYTRNRRKALKANYGLTLDEYEAKLAAQDGKCAICGSADSGREGRSMYVDHSHKTGLNRGLLCIRCNYGIGLFADDPDRLLAAASYLLQYANVLEEEEVVMA